MTLLSRDLINVPVRRMDAKGLMIIQDNSLANWGVDFAKLLYNCFHYKERSNIRLLVQEQTCSLILLLIL